MSGAAALRVRVDAPANYLARFLARALQGRPAGLVTRGSILLAVGDSCAVMRFSDDEVSISSGPGEADARIGGSLAALAKASSRGGIPFGAWITGRIRVRGSIFLALRLLKLLRR